MDKEKKISEIREALEKATPGPWENVRLFYVGVTTEGRFYPVAECDDQNNAILIANAPEWLRFLLEERERMKVEVGECQEHYFAMESMWFKAHRENERLRRELEEAKAGAELEGQLVDDANSDLNEALGENGQLRQERDMYKSSSEVFYERLKKVDEERNRLFERLKVIKTLLGGVTFTDGRLWSAYNALCDIVEDIEKELSK